MTVFWDVIPRRSYKIRRFGCNNCCLRVPRLLVTVNVPSSPILVSPIMEVLSSSETSVLTRAARRNIQEDAIIHMLMDLHIALMNKETDVSDTTYLSVSLS
jgi:hypothetical protein